MKSLLRPLLAALAFGLALMPVSSRAAQPAAEVKVAQLDALVQLSPDQKAQALEIFRNENTVLDGLNIASGDAHTVQTWFATRGKSRDDIGALLAPVQKKVYEHSRQNVGGGLIRVSPEEQVARLDRLVGLTPGQKTVAYQVFDEELESLLDLPSADRLAKGGEFRQTAKAQIRSLLTPEQLMKYNHAPQDQGGGLPANPENMVASLSQLVSLTSVQKAQATQILWNEVDAQLAAGTPEEPPKGFRWTPRVKDQLRAILTPDQQAKFDVTQPYRSNAKAGGKAPAK